MEGQGVTARADESSGRTVAFLVPLLEKLTDREGVRVLIVVPTRRLAAQVYNEVRRLSYYMGLAKAALLDAGSRILSQARFLENDPPFVVGTPGRILDHVRRGNVRFSDLDGIVLLEGDRLLDQGQQKDVDNLFTHVGSTDRTVHIVTALSPAVLRFCRAGGSGAEELFTPPTRPSVVEAEQSFARVNEKKTDYLLDLLETEVPERALIFCRSKEAVRKLGRSLARLPGRKNDLFELHACRSQHRRGRIVSRFNEWERGLMILTDTVLDEIGEGRFSHIVNYHVPEDPEDYLYRLGPIAFSGSPGKAITLVGNDEAESFDGIRDIIGTAIEERITLTTGGAALRDKDGEEPEPDDDGASGGAKPTDEKAKKPLFHGGWFKKLKRWGK